ncbi:thermonuclease family protein [Devosia sp. PTR5]|uniref:Thermonuclease family protein n=1 Tax=Devosia oryzisoli TaxID=2774138 RepID=A0A927IRW1_9HYPH|nr:thermonuclease family protein [Devosia oryzisoli]MBD8064202.1 thermonuclease family protein [Devosia oryzisoli]
MAQAPRFVARAHLQGRRTSEARYRPRVGPLLGQALLVVAALAVGAAGSVILQNSDLASRLLELELPGQTAHSYGQTNFPLCAGTQRFTCVVDGDTFWLHGIKVRVADIDTPEIGSPGCAAELARGRQATARMRELISAGPFELAPADRDQDRYGRKLRIVMRDGRSLGQVLVGEGLAHVWGGPEREWC